jgi:hypothetical protein
MIEHLLISALFSMSVSRPLATQLRGGVMALQQEVELHQVLRIGGAQIQVEIHLDHSGLPRRGILE